MPHIQRLRYVFLCEKKKTNTVQRISPLNDLEM